MSDTHKKSPELSEDEVERLEGEPLPDREVMTAFGTPWSPPPMDDESLLPPDVTPKETTEETGGPYRE